MKYYILLTIPIPETKFYIEVGLDYDIPFHPNLTDEIFIADYPCKIKEIYYNLDNLTYITIRAEATDNLISIRGNPSNENIHQSLGEEYKQLKEWFESNGERIVLNDYYMHPERPYNTNLEDSTDEA